AWTRLAASLAARAPLVLAFEDLHWADEGLLDFLEHLAGGAGDVALTIVCTARPDLLERRPGWQGVVEIEPLSTARTSALMAALPPDAPPSDELAARVGGTPLYAEEYARMLREQPHARDLPLPETVQALIAARVDALPPGEKATLEDAAVVGKG